MTCNACNFSLEAHSFLHCRLCKHEYHYECLNIKCDQFAALSDEYLASWVCPACNNITRRHKSNCNTPVRQHLVPEVGESINMSLDNSDLSVAGTSTSSGKRSKLRSSSEHISMEEIGKIMDLKLKESLNGFMTSFRNMIQDDLKAMVKNEMSNAVDQLRSDFKTSTDLIRNELAGIKTDQANLKTIIDDQSSSINKLEYENQRLKETVRKLDSRVSAIDKMARSHNIEIQAVPETRNEDVVACFKKLTELLDVKIDENSLRSCRRVAKMDPSSNRPRNIVVTLSSPRQRDMILSAAHRFNKKHPNDPLNSHHLGILGNTNRIYVVEHLSPETKLLFANARKTAKSQNFKYVWVRYGRVYLRKDDNTKAIFIKNIETLNNLLP